MMSLLFLMIFLTVCAVWLGKQAWVYRLMSVTFVMATVMFIHHMTSTISIDL